MSEYAGIIYKNGNNVGFYKNIEATINSIVATCEVHRFDIEEYELKDFNGHIVWAGNKINGDVV
jgi:hypothetical protein